MNELQIFNNPEFGAIRTVEIDGEPWLVGKDVAKALGYKDTKRIYSLLNQVASGKNRKYTIEISAGEKNHLPRSWLRGE